MQPDTVGDGRLIQLAFDLWRESGEWTKVGVLQRRLARAGVDIDVQQTAVALDPFVGHVDWQDQTVQLHIQAVAQCVGGEEYAVAFVRLIQLMCARYLDGSGGDDEAPVVTSEECRSRLGLTERVVERLGDLVHTEPLLWQGFTQLSK